MIGSFIRHRVGGFVLVASLTILVIGAANVHAATNPKTPNANSEAGMTDSQRNALYMDAWSAFQAKYRTWVNRLDLSKINLHRLPHRPLLATYRGPFAPTLQTATDAADLIIRGKVTSIRPTPF